MTIYIISLIINNEIYFRGYFRLKLFKYILFLLIICAIFLSACGQNKNGNDSYITQGIKRVGNETFGFLDVSEDFIEFLILGESPSVHYSSEDGEITISILYLGEIAKEFKNEAMADTIMKNFETIQELGAILTDSHETTLDSAKAMGFYAVFADGTAMVILVFYDDDNALRQLSVVARLESESSQNIFEIMTNVENTYTFKN